jgi:hypothetical protein
VVGFHREGLVSQHVPARGGRAEPVEQPGFLLGPEHLLGHLSVARRTYGTDYDKSLDDIVHRELGRLIPAVDLDHLLNEIFDEVSP